MIVRIITAYVKPECIDIFEHETRLNHEGSVAEPGVFRFDVLKDPETPGTYVLYEVYRDAAATEAHKTTSHYKRWKEAVADCMARPRESSAYQVVAPADEAGWA